MNVTAVAEHVEHSLFLGKPSSDPHFDIREVRLDEHKPVICNNAAANFGIARRGEQIWRLARKSPSFRSQRIERRVKPVAGVKASEPTPHCRTQPDKLAVS